MSWHIDMIGEEMNQIPMSFKVSISILCSIAIAVLVVISGEDIHEEKQLSTEYQETGILKDAFTFNPERLIYDGTETLDLLEGVSLPGYTAEELKNNVYVRISTGDSMSQKIVEYTIDTEEGRVRSNRVLQLENYKGPRIQLPDEMPSVTEESVHNITDILLSESTYKADDGFGNDVRRHVQVEMEKALQNSSVMECTFILENEFGDRTVEEEDVVLSDVPATINLTDKIVYLQKGEYFDPLIYVESAVDANGYSIKDEVISYGEYDTSQVGEYLITYELRGQTAVLTVVVN